MTRLEFHSESAMTRGMLNKRYSRPGTAPATLLPHSRENASAPPTVRIIEYDYEKLTERFLNKVDEFQHEQHSKKVTWVNVDGLSDTSILSYFGEQFKIHPLALEDVLNTGQRPKVDTSPDYIFLCLQMFYQDKNGEIISEQVSIFLGNQFVLTIQEEGDYDSFEPIRDRIRAAKGYFRKQGADYLTYALLDSIIDHFYPLVESFGNQIEAIEDQMLDNPSREILIKLHGQRRVLAHIRHYIWPMRDVCHALLMDSSGRFSPGVNVFLRDCYDHSVQLMDFVESHKEVTLSIMDLYNSSVSMRTNEIMRILTVITSIFIPLTFIVGIYGMNFSDQGKQGQALPLNMPELTQPYGYVGVMLVMMLIAVIQLLIFRRMKWL